MPPKPLDERQQFSRSGPRTNPIPKPVNSSSAPTLVPHAEIGTAAAGKKIRKTRSDKKPPPDPRTHARRSRNKGDNGSPSRHAQTEALIKHLATVLKYQGVSFKDIHRHTGLFSSQCSRIFSKKSQAPTSPLCDTIAVIAELVGLELKLVPKTR